MKYFDEDGNIRSALLDEEAKHMADKLVVYYRDRNNNRRLDKNSTLTSAQLRRFFGDFKQLEKKVAKQDFEKVKPLIKMVKSKAAYASQKIIPEFKNFLTENVDNINSKKDFDAFMLHFEAVVGFYYGMEGVKSE